MSESTISSPSWQPKERPISPASREKETRAAEAHQKPVEKPAAKPAEPVDVASSVHMTRMQFLVDTETSDVTIFIRDKETDQVLRSIPAEAMKDLPPGQLLNISS